MGFSSLCLSLLCLLFVVKPASTGSVSGTIETDTTFYHSKLSANPFKAATIQYSVRYKLGGFCIPAMDMCSPTLEFHTTADHINIKERCFTHRKPQVFNEKIRAFLPDQPSSFTKRDKYLPAAQLYSDKNLGCVLNKHSKMVHCTGQIKFQDFRPRVLSFVFGFRCRKYVGEANTLKGLQYNISSNEETNNTNCQMISKGKIKPVCDQFYTHTSLPNLVGSQNMDQVEDILDTFSKINSIWNISGTQKLPFKCHQHFWEIICYFSAPKCNPTTNTTTQLCREMCHDLVDACWENLFIVSEIMSKITSRSEKMSRYFDEDLVDVNTGKLKHWCEYLPSMEDGDARCFYKPVRCPSRSDELKRHLKRTSQTVGNHSSFPVNSVYAVRAAKSVPADSCRFPCETDPSQSVANIPCVWK